MPHPLPLGCTGLINKRAAGRQQLISTSRERLKRASELLDSYEVLWRQRVAQLDNFLVSKDE
jgi:hypothetical protein